MTIAYDVTVMQELVRACDEANSELEKAQNLIREVHSHNDWTCKEKDAIDELMSQCRNMIKRMNEQQRSFLEAVRQVAGELETAENSVSRLFSGVEDLLSGILAIPVLERVINGTGLLGNGSSPDRVIAPDEWFGGEDTAGVMQEILSEIGISLFQDLDL